MQLLAEQVTVRSKTTSACMISVCVLNDLVFREASFFLVVVLASTSCRVTKPNQTNKPDSKRSVSLPVKWNGCVDDSALALFVVVS